MVKIEEAGRGVGEDACNNLKRYASDSLRGEVGIDGGKVRQIWKRGDSFFLVREV